MMLLPLFYRYSLWIVCDRVLFLVLKTLDRKELKNILGGATLACEAPVDGGCSKPGYIFCSNPYCCYPPNRPFICLD